MTRLNLVILSLSVALAHQSAQAASIVLGPTSSWPLAPIAPSAR